MNFWFDRSVPINLARMLDQYDAENVIVHQDDDGRFKKTDPDEHWMRRLAEDNVPWVVVTADLRIIKDKAQRQVFREVNLPWVTYARGWNNISFHERAWKTLRVWPEVVGAVQRARQPTLFEIPVVATKITVVKVIAEL